MSSNKWVRQIHRWVSIAFTVTVIANFSLPLWGRGASARVTSAAGAAALLLFTG